MITIKEIAEICNVSTTTVSNVIHGKTKKVSDQNIRKIRKVLREKRYIPRMGLSSLTNSQSHIIGVVVHIKKYYPNTIIADPFYGELVGFLEESIRQSGYYMMLYTSESLDDIFKMAVSWNVDGLIAISFTENDYHKIGSLTGKPIVAIDLYNESDNDFYNVGLDDEQGGYLMTKYLIDAGYKNILLIGSQNFGVDHHRFLGYKRALAETGLPIKKEDFVIFNENPLKRGEVYKYIMKLVNKNYALFFLSDYLANETLRYLISHGVSIPKEVSIVGFDDNLYARLIEPTLTTIHQDISLKASSAISLLLKLVKKESIESNNIMLPVRLVKRNSVRVLNK